MTGLPGLSYSLDRYGGASIPERVRLPDEPAEHPGRIADVTDLVCPPYDVIGPELRRRLLEAGPHNAVRLEYSPEPDPYRSAAASLAEWRRDAVLARRAEPSVYYYSHATRQRPDELLVHGVLVRLLLEPWGAGVRPHERTHDEPKRDRLELLRATRTQLSPILALYFDRSERYHHVMSRSWTDEWRARDNAGLLHQLAAVEPDERLLNFLARQQLVIADGHHRYESALAYQAEVRAAGAHRGAPPGALGADWIMAVLVNGELEELEILSTHRLLRGLEEPALGALERLAHRGSETFDSRPVPADALAGSVAERAEDESAVFGLVVPSGAYLLTARADETADRMRRERASSAVRRLDLAILHAALFTDVLRLDAERAAAEGRLLYTKDSAEAVGRAQSGDVQAAFLVRPTRIEHLASVARAGDVMPQKSTYFYPKLLTGMVFNPLED